MPATALAAKMKCSGPAVAPGSCSSTPSRLRLMKLPRSGPSP